MDTEVQRREGLARPALAQLVAGVEPSPVVKLRRNVAWHAEQCPSAEAQAAAFRKAQKGPRLEGRRQAWRPTGAREDDSFDNGGAGGADCPGVVWDSRVLEHKLTTRQPTRPSSDSTTSLREATSGVRYPPAGTLQVWPSTRSFEIVRVNRYIVVEVDKVAGGCGDEVQAPVREAGGEPQACEGSTVEEFNRKGAGGDMCYGRYKPWRSPRPASTFARRGKQQLHLEGSMVVDFHKEGADDEDDSCDERSVRFRPWRGPRPTSTKKQFKAVQLDNLIRDVFRRFDADQPVPAHDVGVAPPRAMEGAKHTVVPSSFKHGDLVFACGLAGAKELNGALGEVQCWNEVKGRFAVLFGRERGQKLLKPANLQCATFGAFRDDVEGGAVAGGEQGDAGERGGGLFGDLGDSPNLASLLSARPTLLC